MDKYPILQSDWSALLTLLPSDLEATAASTGALRRKREVKDAATLLRLALVYGYCNLSLRGTAAWASAEKVAELSDVALLKRLKGSDAWLALLLTQQLEGRVEALHELRRRNGRVRLIDATSISRPGSTGTDWRIHLGFDLATLSIDQVYLGGVETGESLRHFTLQPDDIVVTDRGYGYRPEIWRVVQAKAQIIARLNWQGMPLCDAQGQRLDILQALRGIREEDILDLPVFTQTDPKRGVPAMPGRLIATRKSPEQAETARQRLKRHAQKKGKKIDPRTWESAEYIFVFTTLDAEAWSATDVLTLYRFRWQVELAFKRMKSILALDEMAAKDAHLCRTFLLAKLLGALLVEDLALHAGAVFSPCDHRLPAPTFSVAAMESAG